MEFLNAEHLGAFFLRVISARPDEAKRSFQDSLLRPSYEYDLATRIIFPAREDLLLIPILLLR